MNANQRKGLSDAVLELLRPFSELPSVMALKVGLPETTIDVVVVVANLDFETLKPIYEAELEFYNNFPGLQIRFNCECAEMQGLTLDKVWVDHFTHFDVTVDENFIQSVIA